MTQAGLHPPPVEVPAGNLVNMEGEEYYLIRAYDLLPPFLMSLASDTDVWAFISSRGGLTAGRRDPDGAILPYETVDRLHDAHSHSGPLTMLRVIRGGSPPVLWRPLAEEDRGTGIQRNLYKNTLGNRIVFEEVHPGLGLSFRYRWASCDEFGLVRTVTLRNRGSEPVRVDVLDGLRNLLPYGAPLALYQRASCLVDAYKHAEVDRESSLAIFSLTAKITDRAEAAEELRANLVWSQGLPGATIHLSGDAPAGFRGAGPLPESPVVRGRRGNYFVCGSLSLAGDSAARWHLVADAGRDHAQLADLRQWLRGEEDPGLEIESSLDRARENLQRIVGSADGLQLTGHPEAAAHHLASTLFNCMRGGVCANGYEVPVEDLARFLRTRNLPVWKRHQGLLDSLPPKVPGDRLLREAMKASDPDLERLCREYVPIFFGRRHGDPSRPWNRFSIRVRNRDGSPALHFEGNWRDLFQNWEALSLSYPALLPDFVAKFVNASTVDGFNPYRITRDGIDWEIVDPRDPWSNIGYWGDHQIIYLLRFLEALTRFAPGTLESLLEREVFSYADVPYRLKPFSSILRDPRASIEYDTERADAVAERVSRIGTDGKLLSGPDGSVRHVNLLEKLLVPALGKLSNLVPGGGIWMNTQRPEWNDANNALAGNGVSMVTLCHLYRYLRFLEGILKGWGVDRVRLSSEVAEWLDRVLEILAGSPPPSATDAMDDRDRFRLMVRLGEAFSDYRERVYSSGFSGSEQVPVSRILSLCRWSTEHTAHSIRGNRRRDGLFHSYNLLRIDEEGETMSLVHLSLMLEGQVAILDSGILAPGEAAELVERLFGSRLYSPEQRSFLLYPEHDLPGFLEKNAVPETGIAEVPLLSGLLDAGDGSIVVRDRTGACHFVPDFRNADDLAIALDRLAETEAWSEQVMRDRNAVLELFEDVFRHRTFTGRSGTMYGYEGIGCIYWHMVAKLLLAVQAVALESSSQEARDSLARSYFRIRSGLGFEKTVREFGAFPTDPYSHTPSHGGAQQPGMTGQVKEEILARFGELGLRVEQGALSFRPALLQLREFLEEPGTYRYRDLEGQARVIDLPAGALAFSVCQVPVVYRLTEAEGWIRTVRSDGTTAPARGTNLDRAASRQVFARTGSIARIEVGIPRGWLHGGGAPQVT